MKPWMSVPVTDAPRKFSLNGMVDVVDVAKQFSSNVELAELADSTVLDAIGCKILGKAKSENVVVDCFGLSKSMVVVENGRIFVSVCVT